MTTPFELKMTEQEAFDGLKKQFGTEFTTPEVRAFCAMNDIAYATAVSYTHLTLPTKRIV